MYVVYIKNYKKKALLSCCILAVWALALLIFGVLLNSSLIFSVTINKFLTFSYPLSFQVDHIYINEHYGDSIIETSAPFSKPRPEKFSSFTSIEGKFSFDYPSVFSLNRQEFTGTEILYHIGFKSKSNPTHGFVQVWNLPHSLEDFLYKAESASGLNFKDFNSKSIIVNKLPGYLWEYSFLNRDGHYFKGNEVFLKRDDTMYRISYFIPEESWNKEQSDIFLSIVRSFKTL